MKKYLPVSFFLLGIIVLTGTFFILRSRKGKEAQFEEEESFLKEIPFEKRPFVSLIPEKDGHYLTFSIEKLGLIDAESLDYELLYQVPDGASQGVPGTVDLKGKDSFEADLLLGSESSGKFRYDEGVERGTLTLRFRNAKGKLIAKFQTDFHLQTGMDKLTSIDNKFSCTFVDAPGEHFWLTMGTFGVFQLPPGNVSEGPYGVFRSSGSKDVPSGKVALGGESVYRLASQDSQWLKLESSSDYPCEGIFVGFTP
ncbi:hypothetical protein A2686_03105 [Candidatus Woesebacteria bacterium RIFCSPHIGHO2_01_FULL_38_10]|uniref:Uncharacterized protein n=1 Tax=Candidatus Woesebacteria bacterium RIFCSPLOWO2_01_FULL_39_10b TaxID=1802517 RepID=A0A1F8B5I6_9BACT|nr:MAG: hypothetical protein A2686_03105 [Candidatus Woesebacteria bacterium RIFCSPHIGHO2_01_FULL_38_10]OGM59304.1 MAG: hypothetical protein A2892_05580 [Candidatus Woesebacteria bacterium RIFCSPLOWO2_01_FULL_39_10b]